MTESWQISIDRLSARDSNEDGGDEPYLVVVGFRSRFYTLSSTIVSWGGHLDDEWASGIVSGASAGQLAGTEIVTRCSVSLS